MGARILVVEDELAIQQLLALTLKSAGHQPTLVSNAEEALACINTELPDLIVLDWMLPGRSGIALARQLRNDARTRGLPIIMLTARAQEADKVAGLETGADDYITKPFSQRELIARVKALLRRHAPDAGDELVLSAGLLLDPPARRVTCNGAKVPLGPTEFRLLHFLMTHPDRVYTRGQLLDQVWGDHVFIEERTVDVHIRRLRAALESTGHDRLVETVRGSGYRFDSA